MAEPLRPLLWRGRRPFPFYGEVIAPAAPLGGAGAGMEHGTRPLVPLFLWVTAATKGGGYVTASSRLNSHYSTSLVGRNAGALITCIVVLLPNGSLKWIGRDFAVRYSDQSGDLFFSPPVTGGKTRLRPKISFVSHFFPSTGTFYNLLGVVQVGAHASKAHHTKKESLLRKYY